MKRFLTLLLISGPTILFAQFGVSFHQTNLPFIGVSYEIANRIRPELRLGTDRYLEDISLEGVVVGDILNKEDYELYLGIGVSGGGEFEGHRRVGPVLVEGTRDAHGGVADQEVAAELRAACREIQLLGMRAGARREQQCGQCRQCGAGLRSGDASHGVGSRLWLRRPRRLQV